MPTGPQVPRWVAPLLGFVALFLIPWTLYLTLTLPSRHVTHHYDLAWVGFDIVTSQTGGEIVEASLEAVFGELPLAALCAYIVVDVERFQATFDRFRRPTPAARRAALRAMSADARAERREAPARPDRRA